VTILGAGLAVQAQEPISNAAVAFSGASVKLNKATPVWWGFDVSDDGRRVEFRGTVWTLIASAYDIEHPKQRIKQAPDWLSSEYFEVRAIPAEGAPRDHIPLMTQSLLIDRFKLRAHWEIRDEPVYALELARQDGQLRAGLQRSKHDCNAFWESGGKGDAPDAPRDDKGQSICVFPGMRVAGREHWGGRPWSDLFMILALRAEFMGSLDRPIVDNTALSGNYDLHLEFRNELGGLPTTLTKLAQPSIKDALQEQLGLKLLPKNAPWKVLVIDSVERPMPD
jgi:uncharacterized protein (TIGR03435 family)